MKYIFLFALAIFLHACTPKTGDRVAVEPDVTDRGIDINSKEDFRTAAPTPGPAPEIKMGDFEEMTLENGAKLIVVENHKIPRVSIQIFVDQPPMNEGDKSGMSAIAGQLLGRGTTTMSKAELDEAIDFMGASLNTNSSGMFATALTRHLEPLMTIMRDVLMNPAMSEDEFEKIKKETLSGLAAAKENPNAIAGNVSSVVRYGKSHPYGEVETEATVQNITLNDVKGYINNYLRPNNAYITMVGDITPTEAKRYADRFFGDWTPKEMPKQDLPMVSVPESRQVAFVDKAGAVQSVINVTYPVDLKPGSDDMIAATLMNSILGNSGFGARLIQNLREGKAYTYGAYSSLNSDPYMGSFTASASVRNEVTDSSVVEFLYELDRIVKESVTQEELDRVKAVQTGRFARSLESPNTVARYALNMSRYNYDKDYYEDYLKRVNAVTLDDIRRVAAKYIRPENAYVVVVGNKDEVADKLARFDADGKVTFYDNYGNELEDNTATVPAGVNATTVLTDYINAVGGMENIMKVKDASITMAATTQFGEIGMKMKMKAPNKMRQQTLMGGATMNDMIFDGNKGVSKAQGQTMPMDEKMAANLKTATYPISEVGYLKAPYQSELKGIEMIDGKPAYKLVITDPSGVKSTHFYDQKSGLKVQEIQTQEGPQGPITQTIKYADYRTVGGVKMPYNMIMSGGGMPFTLDLKTTDIQVNTNLSDDEFSTN